MNIETEITPNPETLKFIIGKEYISQSGIEIKNEKEAQKFKFAKDCFQLKGVNRIFIGENFVAITKDKNVNWNYLKTKILTFILDFLSLNKILIEKNVIKKVNRPTLVLSHNKTLAAQLYTEFKQFFPKQDKYPPDFILIANNLFEDELQDEENFKLLWKAYNFGN